MKTVKIPVVVLMGLIALLAVTLYALIQQGNKQNGISEMVAGNDRLRLENDRFAMLDKYRQTNSIEEKVTREPVGFKLPS